MATEKTNSGTFACARLAYMHEVARGRSHISSTLNPDSRLRAIAEILGEFRRIYGAQSLEIFQELLLEDLERRGNCAAVSALRDFK
ncbi:hypothetical protein [Paraburkholderia aspalathi]|uniref:hypothetical protein n=1 Tax=Paraburkholderia aspalathi TaxID=1324617 RepID=UPI0038B76C98